MADKNELLVEHYHKTFDLTTRLWEQRNRLFLFLIGVIGLSAILTFRGSEANPLFLDMIIKILGITDVNRVNEIRGSFPFALLHGVLLLVVFYLMFNLYHRALSVLMQYAYLGSLEKEIRESLQFKVDEKAFTRESDFYWRNRPALMGTVKWVYMLLLGLLLLAFLIGRLVDDYHSGSLWLVWIDIVVSIPTLIYFFGYASSSVTLDSKEAIVPKAGPNPVANPAGPANPNPGG
jgi:hypothetical protein